VEVTNGGTGTTATVSGGVVYGASATAMATTAVGNSGQVLASKGSGAPEWTSIGLTPTGSIMIWPGTTAPDGWFICDGSAISTTTFATLYAVIGTLYGSGTGTFSLPNLKGRIPVGLDASQSEFTPMAKTGGAKTHQLSTAEMPSHSHDVNPASVSSTSEGSHTHTVDPPSTSTSTNGNHTHTYVDEHEDSREMVDYPNETYVSDNQTSETKTTSAAGNHTHTVDIAAFASGAVSAHTHTVDVPNTTSTSVGSSNSHNNLQPYIIMNYIIKY